MTFYFAWVGGDPTPEFILETKGDVWGGSWTTLGSTWNGELATSGDILGQGSWESKAQFLSNLRNIAGLVEGQSYLITGPGISTSLDHVNPDTIFIFDGQYGGFLSHPAEPAENVGVRISSIYSGVVELANRVQLDDISGIPDIGAEYFISGGGIPANTTFTFDGTNVAEISRNATSTARNAAITISTDTGRDRITNLADTTDLVVGDVYQVFGLGVPPAALAIYQSDGSLQLTEPARISQKQTFLRIRKGITYPDGGDFNESVHARNDETVLSIQIDHSEGNAATLDIELKNPRIGFLAPGRNVWCWLSWKETDTGPVIPLFHGRLIAVPADILAEKVTLKFLAKPDEYESKQSLVAAAMKGDPQYDPIWYTNGVADNNTILEGRTVLWHIDRVNLDVSTSDLLVGEDGTLEIGERDHLYADMQIRFGSPPKRGVYMTGTVNWSQEAEGKVYLTDEVIGVFGGKVQVFSGQGLEKSWPKPFGSIGGGWTWGADCSISESLPAQSERVLISKKFSTAFTVGDDQKDGTGSIQWEEMSVTFSLNVYDVALSADYVAKRSWQETVSFLLESDTQEIVTDSRALIESFALSSSTIEQPIDPGGATPLADRRYNSYFKTERGQQSFKWLLWYARAKLMMSARAVEIRFVTKFVNAIVLSCRWNAHIVDHRIPGGEATGKVTSYKLIASASAGMRAEVTIGCTVGKGGTLSASTGSAGYADGIGGEEAGQATIGGTVDVGDGSITYQSFDDFQIVDDGINFFDMTPKNVIKRFLLTVPLSAQIEAISQVRYDANSTSSPLGWGNGVPNAPPDPGGALRNTYPVVILELKPVTGGAFLTEIAVKVSRLQIPKTINLEAPSA